MTCQEALYQGCSMTNEGMWTDSRELKEAASTGIGDTLEMGQREEFRMTLGFSIGMMSNGTVYWAQEKEQISEEGAEFTLGQV